MADHGLLDASANSVCIFSDGFTKHALQDLRDEVSTTVFGKAIGRQYEEIARRQ